MPFKALQKTGFRILRQGKHVVRSDGVRIVTIPRHNPVNAFTMGGIARDAGLRRTIQEASVMQGRKRILDSQQPTSLVLSQG
jgi:predicted RNA binding protein YcfA (HicA-like mRNA interferase family)